MVWFVLLYLVPMFLVIGFAISLVDPHKDDDAQMLFICGVLSIIPVINIITAYSLGQVLIQHRN